jgi:DNA-binding MarR family transcriptional regulator
MCLRITTFVVLRSSLVQLSPNSLLTRLAVRERNPTGSSADTRRTTISRESVPPTRKTAQVPTLREYARAAQLREALRLFQRRTEEVTAAHRLTPRLYQLLLMIKTSRDHSERAGLTELEQRLQLGKSTVTELVLRAEKRGLVRRDLDRERGRGISISLTPTGQRRLAAALGELGDERRRLINILSRSAT